ALLSSTSVLASTVVWEINDATVHSAGTAETFYQPSHNLYFLFLPKWGRNVQIYLHADTLKPGTFNCPGSHVFGLITSDNGFDGLDKLPPEWKSLSVAGCGKASSGDLVTKSELTISTLRPDRVAGRYDLVIDGAGPRSGSTLRVSGEFDEKPKV